MPQRWWFATCIAAFTLTLCDAATAQFTCEVDNVVADDQAVKQWYGRSVSIATTRAAIGAPRDAEAAADAGAVYILERTGLRATDSDTGWLPFAKLMANDAASGDRLGYSVAISEDGNTVVAGAYRRIEGGLTNSGAAYVFVRDGNGTWSQDAKLLPSNPSVGAEFGTSVAIDGDYIVVGAPGGGVTDGDGNPPGTAYLFERTGSAWTSTIETILAPSTIRGAARFGGSVSISGDVVVVGAYLNDSVKTSIGGVPWYTNVGSAHIFRRAGDAWPQEQVIGDACLFEDQDQNRDCNQTQFGFSVSIDGNAVLIGARYGRGLDGEYTGAAYVFRWVGGTWFEEQKLIADNGQSDDDFGYSVALHGDFALVGARDKSVDGVMTGSAYLFNRLSGSWMQEIEVTPDTGLSGDRFGGSVALGEEYALVGAYRHPHDGIPDDAGSAYFYGYGSGRDCNANGVHDDCEILASEMPPPFPPGLFLLDTDANGTIDECKCVDSTDCDDGLDCTIDTCGADLLCEFTVQEGFCAIAGECFPDGADNPLSDCEWCDAALNPGSWTPDSASCPTDGNVCTDEVCLAGSCQHIPVADGTPCPTGLFCVVDETCTSGTCSGEPRDCDDGIGCAADTCDEDTDSCNNVTGDSFCVIDDICYEDQAVDPGSPCRFCDALANDSGWTLVPDDTACADDGIPCTDDTCRNGLCHVVVENQCAIDGVCYNAGDEQPGQPCLACIPGDNPTAWSNRPDGWDCGNDIFCDGEETCSAGACVSTGAPCGADGLSCDDVLNACTCTTDAACDDGAFCNGAESCGGGLCLPGIPPCIALGLLCSEPLDRCVECLLDTDCDDGLFCNGMEVCIGLECVSSPPPCPTDGFHCDETEDQCECQADAACDDGLFCTGTETCVAGQCLSPGDPCIALGRECAEIANQCRCRGVFDCNDGNACTDDACLDELCYHTDSARGAPCGEPAESDCDLPDTCDGNGHCGSNIEPNGQPCIPDNVICTDDVCWTGVCRHTDCWLDGRPVVCELDCNSNGASDACDIDQGDSNDCNVNDTPDECETLSDGDFDADLDIDLVDLAGLIDCLSNPGTSPSPPLGRCLEACITLFDADRDDDVDLIDVGAFLRVYSGSTP